MIGLDTNILVRVAIDDDPEQDQIARARVHALTTAEPGFVSQVVLVETWWVLTRTYRRSSAAVAGFISGLCASSAMVIENRDQVEEALEVVRERHADFADALIVAVARAAGCGGVETFDQGAVLRAGMTHVESQAK
jgi:predicted nucleic-acid-binding protein